MGLYQDFVGAKPATESETCLILAGRVRPNRSADPGHRPDPATSDGALRTGSRNTLRQGPGVHAGGKKVAGQRRRRMGAGDDRADILGRRFGVSRRLCVPHGPNRHFQPPSGRNLLSNAEAGLSEHGIKRAINVLIARGGDPATASGGARAARTRRARSEGPIAGGRELWGFPKKLAQPTLRTEFDTAGVACDVGCVQRSSRLSSGANSITAR